MAVQLFTIISLCLGLIASSSGVDINHILRERVVDDAETSHGATVIKRSDDSRITTLEIEVNVLKALLTATIEDKETRMISLEQKYNSECVRKCLSGVDVVQLPAAASNDNAPFVHRFSSPFHKTPHLMVAANGIVTMLHEHEHASIRLSVLVDEITSSHMKLSVDTWPDHYVGGVAVQWMACA